MADLLALAREAAIKVQGESTVGAHLTSIDEGEPGVATHLFASKLRGYPDWTWAVTTFTDAAGEISISEVNLLPSDTSLIAPKWVPWAERLADYKALQAALEEQAKAEAEEAAANAVEGEQASESDDEEAEDDILDVEEDDEEGSDSASGLSDESEDSESDADDAGAEPKSFFRYKFIRRHKKRK